MAAEPTVRRMVQYGYERVGTLTVETEEPFGTPFHNERFRYGTSSHGDAQVKFCMCLFGSECFNLTTNKPDGGSKNPQSISWSPLESADDGCQFYRISFKPCAGKHAPTTAIQKIAVFKLISSHLPVTVLQSPGPLSLFCHSEPLPTLRCCINTAMLFLIFV